MRMVRTECCVLQGWMGIVASWSVVLMSATVRGGRLEDDGAGVGCPARDFLNITGSSLSCPPYDVYEHYTLELNVPALTADVDFVSTWAQNRVLPLLRVVGGNDGCGAFNADGGWTAAVDGKIVASGQFTGTKSSFSASVCPWAPSSNCSSVPAASLASSHRVTFLAVNNGDLTCLRPYVSLTPQCVTLGSGTSIVMQGDLCTNGTVWAFDYDHLAGATTFTMGGCAHNNYLCPSAYACCPDGSAPPVQQGCGVNCIDCENSCPAPRSRHA